MCNMYNSIMQCNCRCPLFTHCMKNGIKCITIFHVYSILFAWRMEYNATQLSVSIIHSLHEEWNKMQYNLPCPFYTLCMRGTSKKQIFCPREPQGFSCPLWTFLHKATSALFFFLLLFFRLWQRLWFQNSIYGGGRVFSSICIEE